MRKRQTHRRHSGNATIQRAFQGAEYGGLVGAVLLCIGLARGLFALIGRALSKRPVPPATDSDIRDLLVLAVVYCAAFAAAGAVCGTFWFLRKSRVGAYSLGYFAAMIVCAAVSGLVELHQHSGSIDLLRLGISTGILTLVFGTVAGYLLRQWDRWG